MNELNTHKELVSTARLTGIWYLLMAISGVLGFLVYHSQIFVSGAPDQTLTNLINLESTARIRLLLEFAIVLSQTLTAVWFYKLFKSINEWAAWSVGIWGMINAVMILVSAVAIASAIGISGLTDMVTEDKIVLVTLLQHIIASAWGIGGLFFGLWLIPMGYIVITSKRMPVWLGRIMILGGVGYILSSILNYSGLQVPYLDLFTIPATIGEFWMIGYLLWFGIRPEQE
jgi:hypothetical protein